MLSLEVVGIVQQPVMGVGLAKVRLDPYAKRFYPRLIY